MLANPVVPVPELRTETILHRADRITSSTFPVLQEIPGSPPPRDLSCPLMDPCAPWVAA
jgi:hypothetical protein